MIKCRCKNCKITFYIRKALWKYHNGNTGMFCSLQCFGQYKINNRLKKICGHCSKVFHVPKTYSYRKYCCKKCYNTSRSGISITFSKKHLKNLKISIKKRDFFREKNPNWKGGRRGDGQGYILIYCPDHPNKICGDYMYEHRIVMENHIGRYLSSIEQVHHINGIKSDNRIENLILFDNPSDHTKFHNSKLMVLPT